MITINNRNSNINISFNGYAPTQVIKVYRQLDNTFIQEARNQGIGRSTILAIIEKMSISPKFELKALNDIKNELSQRIEQVIEIIDNTNSIEELKNSLMLPLETIKTLLCKRQQAKRNLAISEGFEKGESIEDLAKKFEIKESTIEQILRTLGISLNHRVEKANKAIEMLKQGAIGREVAEKLGLHTSTIKAIRKREHIPDSRCMILERKHSQIIEKLKAGISHRDIANEFKMSKCKIDEIAMQLGFKEAANAIQKSITEKLQNRTSVNKIAEELGISITEVLKETRALGFTTQDARSLREAAIFEALKTKKVTDIAKEFDVAINTVYNIKRKHPNC